MLSGKLYPQTNIDYDCLEKIYEHTLTEAASSITISNLTGDTDETYLLSFKGYGSSAGWALMRFNGDAGSNYGYQQLVGNNSTISSQRVTGATSLLCSHLESSYGQSISIINSGVGDIKSVLTSFADEVTGTTVTYCRLFGASWNNSLDELTSITIFPETGDLVLGTSVSLYRKVSAA